VKADSGVGLLGFVLVACGLCGALAYEIMMPVTAAHRVMSEPPPLALHRWGSRRPVPTTASRTGWVATILARPLFSPVRRPMEAGDGVSHEKGTLRLSGTIIVGKARVALFALDDKDAKNETPIYTGPGYTPPAMRPEPNRSIAIGEGARIGPFIVTSIDDGRVVLSKDGQQQVFTVRFAAFHESVPSTPQPPPPPPSNPFTPRGSEPLRE
jgi:hypothetical protein